MDPWNLSIYPFIHLWLLYVNMNKIIIPDNACLKNMSALSTARERHRAGPGTSRDAHDRPERCAPSAAGHSTSLGGILEDFERDFMGFDLVGFNLIQW